jgi:hypothetical protein
MVYLNDKYIPKLIELLKGFKYKKKNEKSIFNILDDKRNNIKVLFSTIQLWKLAIKRRDKTTFPCDKKYLTLKQKIGPC